MSLHALPVVNAELFCKRWVYSLPRESNGGVHGRWLPTHITHSISSSHLLLDAVQLSTDCAQTHISAVCRHCRLWCRYLVSTTRSAGCKRCNALVKVDHAVYGCADLNDQDWIRSSRWSIRIRSIKIGSEFSIRIGSNLRCNANTWTWRAVNIALSIIGVSRPVQNETVATVWFSRTSRQKQTKAVCEE